METRINICNQCVFISLSNDLLFDYVRNRYSGFASTNEANVDFRIIEVDRKTAYNQYKVKFDFNNQDRVIQERSERFEYYFVSNESIVVYDMNEHLCVVCVSEKISNRLIYLVGVIICDIVSQYLATCDIYCIHSSVVSFKGDISNGIAFLGESGVGKTSLAYEFVKKKEKIVNDDVAYFQYDGKRMRAYKNTQYIGLDEKSLCNLYSECKSYVVKKDGLSLDKNRIDLNGMDAYVYAEYIDVKKIIIINSVRSENAKLVPCDKISLYKHIFQSMIPFIPSKIISQKAIVDRLLSSNIIAYKLTPANTAKKTIEGLYEIIG